MSFRNNITDELPKKQCSSCAALIDENALICPYCGREQTFQGTNREKKYVPKFKADEELRMCRHCKEVISAKDLYCSKCGKLQKELVTRRIICILIALFIGLIIIYAVTLGPDYEPRESNKESCIKIAQIIEHIRI